MTKLRLCENRELAFVVCSYVNYWPYIGYIFVTFFLCMHTMLRGPVMCLSFHQSFDDDSIILLQGMRYCLHVNLIGVRAHIGVQVHLLSD